MTGAGATPPIRTALAEEPRDSPSAEQASATPAEASPLWPLVMLLGEIATRVEREQAWVPARTTTTDEPAHDAA